MSPLIRPGSVSVLLIWVSAFDFSAFDCAKKSQQAAHFIGTVIGLTVWQRITQRNSTGIW
ncbi:MAG: hypothetical protein RLZZ458_3696 [Planctomycetota bacterium]